MPTYKITTPDGRAYNVTAPEGASQQQVLDYAKQHHETQTAQPLQPPQQTPNTNIIKDIGYRAGAAKDIYGAAKDTLSPDQYANKFKTALTNIENAKPDYKTGLPFAVKTGFGRQDNDAERKTYLEKYYPKESIKQDDSGKWLVKDKNGRFVEVYGSAPVENFASDLTANIGPIGGAVVGGAMGGLAGGPPGAIAGAGMGATLGKGAAEIQKSIEGTRRASPADEIKRLGEAGLENAAVEGVGQGVNAGVRALGRFAQKNLFGITPETKNLTAQVLRSGGKPPIQSALPSAKVTQFHENLARLLNGSWTDASNFGAVDKEMKRLLANSGIKDTESALREIRSKDVSESGLNLGEKAKSKLDTYVSKLEKEASSTVENANKMLDTRLRNITQKLEVPPQASSLGSSLGAALQQSRKEFGQEFSKGYAKVDQLLGNRAVVPTKIISKEAKNILKSLPKDKFDNPIFSDSEVESSISKLANLKDNITLSNAQDIRHALGKLAASKDLNIGVAERQFNILRDSVNRAITAAAKDPSATKAVNLLRTLDKGYATGVRKYDLGVAKTLVTQAKSAAVPDPSTIARQIVRKGFSEQAQQIKNMVGERLWKRVAEQDFKNILVDSLEKGEISGKKFYKAVNSRGSLLETTYGKSDAAKIKNYAERLAARDGTIPKEKLSPDNIVSALKKADAAQIAKDEFFKRNYLAELTGKESDQVMKFLVKPGEGERLDKAIKFFGENSEIVGGLRQTALKNILSEAETGTASGAGRDVNGDAISKALNKFTKKQRSLLFPNGLDDDLYHLAKQVNFMFPKGEGDMAAGLAAGSLKSKLPFGTLAKGALLGGAATGHLQWAATAYGYATLTGFLLSRPGIVKALVFGLEKGDSTTLNLLSNALEEYALTKANANRTDTGNKNENPSR